MITRKTTRKTERGAIYFWLHLLACAAPFALVCAGVLASASAETLHYTVNWPSGLSLGEATLRSDRTVAGTGSAPGWEFELNLDAGVPGFAIRDLYHSTASVDFCSSQLDKKLARGARKSEERMVFDPSKNTATRETIRDGNIAGTSQISVPSCARDALTLLQFVRKELEQGRLPSPQPAILGAAYQVRLEYLGTSTVLLGDQQVDADRFRTSIKGPASDLTLEMFFRRDAVRTPVMMKIPLSLATFTVELIP
jgi:hypothetical protein